RPFLQQVLYAKPSLLRHLARSPPRWEWVGTSLADAFVPSASLRPALRKSTGSYCCSDSPPSLLRARRPLWSSPGLRPCGIATACAVRIFRVPPLRVCCAKKNPSVTAPLLACPPGAAAVPSGRCSSRIHVGPSLRFVVNGP